MISIREANYVFVDHLGLSQKKACVNPDRGNLFGLSKAKGITLRKNLAKFPAHQVWAECQV